ncbi:hypothetical protein GB931_04480 [Modestobacter sp. I12A-02628]|uniref:Uncharacterized protein n=1 Tax=Goekera deserti TaxID=2497753 RepID=A0A7K3WDM7_9ACTN|nr:hypothetical protein [Goekera deserti]MPQ97194.1 hypothetical protein [Goekera deserti]NDI46488.1 hypothetical protein [Goekera deserti]NEL54578.1 hypothetical protein [Goekera deserti]
MPDDDRSDVTAWSRSLLWAPGPPPAGDGAGDELLGYLCELVETRVCAPEDDLISALARVATSLGALDEHELVQCAQLLIVEAFESVVAALGAGMAAVARHAGDRRDVGSGAGAVVGLVASAIDEALRPAPAVPWPLGQPGADVQPVRAVLGAGHRGRADADLARVHLHVLLCPLIRRFPGLRPAVPLEQLPRHPSGLALGFDALPVVW